MLHHSAASHRGAVRGTNQDAWLCRPEIGLFAVADGAGGHQDGALAARTMLERLDALPVACGPAGRLPDLRSGVSEAHRRLWQAGRARRPPALLATTLVALLLHDRHFACVWAGDSRAYLLRDGRLHRLTSDHSLVQALVDAGDITEAEAERHPQGHVITRAIGAEAEAPALDKALGELREGDRFLLCSDGLYRSLSEAAIAGRLACDGDCAALLVEAALAVGARDNVTAVAVCATAVEE
ncbi:serine/threonine-protein phosphatase [Rhodovastum atsumiense]|uniref:Serine/threonine-protein phosphatase n=2 Tax=Rhodovastum atsumiense TaxID=504468 RepID=A0A5M6IZL8_9PROT|nr:serine/threonine-protein phosphatase [Rhodovastum atsumiense]